MSVTVQPSDKPKRYQTTSGASVTSLTIPNRTGHRRWLHDYWVKDGASGYTNIQIGNNVVGRIYDNLAQAVFISGPSKKQNNRGFLGLLEQYIPKFPILNAAQDESIVFTRDSTADLMLARWEDQDSGDVVAHTLPGGSQPKVQPFFLNLSNPSTISATATGIVFNQLDMPTGVSIFSDSNRISSNNRFTMYGIAANVPKNTNSKTTRIHVFDEFTELFTSETNAGLLVDPDLEGELTWTTNPWACYWLEDPYVWQPNVRMTVTGDATIAGGNNLNAGTQQVFMIGVREYL